MADTYNVLQILNQVVHEKGLSIVHPDTMLISKIIGIDVDTASLRAIAAADDEAKLEMKMELVQKFHSRIEKLF